MRQDPVTPEEVRRFLEKDARWPEMEKDFARTILGLFAERDSAQAYTLRLTEQNLMLLRWQSVASDAHIDHLLAMVESLAANDETPRVLRAISADGITSELRRAFTAERINRAKSEAEVVRLRKVAEALEGRVLEAERQRDALEKASSTPE